MRTRILLLVCVLMLMLSACTGDYPEAHPCSHFITFALSCL